MEYLKTWLRYIVRLPQRAWHWYKGLYRGAPWWKKWLVGLASLLGFFVFYLFAVYVNLFWLFGKSPTIDEIMHPENSLASEIYTEDGVLIGKYFNENRYLCTQYYVITYNMEGKDLNRLKVVLAEKKRTNKWLAEQIGVDQATVSKWCTNSAQPNLENLMEVAKCLEVNVNELLRM